MAEKNKDKGQVLKIDHQKANVRHGPDCMVQTMPKRWWNRPDVRNMLSEAYLFLELKDGHLVIEIRRPTEGEVIEEST